MRVRQDPGACIVCGAAHCSCADADQLSVVQLPARDAAVAAAKLADTPAEPETFSTATYRGTKGKR